ncbi:hypothetical protein HHI36_010457 [Cryptolaemus montrouzieri]|uniref:Uncharacterized protein n=1 Tax=Cryptolaemus montrouzieri TaxID=559131 RepID=A0ABD2MJ72_9CUCU
MCTNCTRSNNRFKTTYNTTHMITDSGECEILKFKLKKLVASTDYPSKPVVPEQIDYYMYEIVSGSASQSTVKNRRRAGLSSQQFSRNNTNPEVLNGNGQYSLWNLLFNNYKSKSCRGQIESCPV